jgi:hypothetical protein
MRDVRLDANTAHEVLPVHNPHHLVGLVRELHFPAQRPDVRADSRGRRGVAGGSNDPLPIQVQPGGPLAVVPQVAEGPHAYVGAALRMMATSPPSRAITRLQALMRQQP